LITAGRHRPSDQGQYRLVRRYATHNLRRNGFVTPCERSQHRNLYCLFYSASPPIMIHASTGCARIISSVSILIKLRRNMLVGAEKLSATLMVGKSIASPPASCTPLLAASMSCRVLPWPIQDLAHAQSLVERGLGVQGLKPLEVLMIPMIGRDRASSPYPRALMKTFRRNREK
jgi:hypothetical protein